MKEKIGVISYFIILGLFILSIEISSSIAAENEAKDNNITWDLINIETSASTEKFVITEYVEELKMDKIKQSTTSESKR